MTDRLDFEARLEERLRARAAVASRPFDAAAIAHQAVRTGGRRRFGGSLRLTDWSALRSAALALLVLALVAAGIVAGSRLLQREAPVSSDDLLSATPSMPPSASVQPSPTAAIGRIIYTREKKLRNGEEDCTTTSAGSCRRTSVFIANADGSDERLFVPGQHSHLLAASPDGSHVLVQVLDPDGDHLYITDATGSALQRFETRCDVPCSGDFEFAFSPDGTRLATLRTRTDETSLIAITDVATGVVEELESTIGIAGSPGWSPDGSRLAFANFVVDADGGNLRQIAPASLFTGLPGESGRGYTAAQWSPDGSLIAFASFNVAFPTNPPERNAQQLMDIYVVRPDGTNLRRLTTETVLLPETNDPGDFGAAFPAWTREGRITYSRFPMPPDTEFELWVIDPDGTDATRLDPDDPVALTALGCVVCTYPVSRELSVSNFAYWIPTP
jgi:hypothetical protein